MKFTFTLLVIAALVAPAGLVAAHNVPAGNINCRSQEPVHVYLQSPGKMPPAWSKRTGTSSPPVIAGDGNLSDCNGDGFPFDYDGDPEWGVGGTAHPTSSTHYGDRSSACGFHSAHHDPTFTLRDHAGATVAFVVAADNTQVDADPTTPAIDGCTTDGIISPMLDPNDCLTPLAVTPSILGIPSSGTCEGGWDGLTWVFILEGAVAIGGMLVLSTPTNGDTW